jgi:hypothetical protein
MQLEVGDKVCVSSQYISAHILTVERVTKTLAVAGAQKFKREYDGKRICFQGYAASWLAEFATPAIIAKINERDKRTRLIQKIQSSVLITLPTEDLEQIANLVEWKCKSK